MSGSPPPTVFEQPPARGRRGSRGRAPVRHVSARDASLSTGASRPPELPRSGRRGSNPRPQAWEAVPRSTTCDVARRLTRSTMRVSADCGRRDPHGPVSPFSDVWGMSGARRTRPERPSCAPRSGRVIVTRDRLRHRRRPRSRPTSRSVTRWRSSSAARTPSASSRRCGATILRSRRSSGSKSGSSRRIQGSGATRTTEAGRPTQSESSPATTRAPRAVPS